MHFIHMRRGEICIGLVSNLSRGAMIFILIFSLHKRPPMFDNEPIPPANRSCHAIWDALYSAIAIAPIADRPETDRIEVHATPACARAFRSPVDARLGERIAISSPPNVKKQLTRPVHSFSLSSHWPTGSPTRCLREHLPVVVGMRPCTARSLVINLSFAAR